MLVRPLPVSGVGIAETKEAKAAAAKRIDLNDSIFDKRVCLRKSDESEN